MDPIDGRQVQALPPARFKYDQPILYCTYNEYAEAEVHEGVVVGLSYDLTRREWNYTVKLTADSIMSPKIIYESDMKETGKSRFVAGAHNFKRKSEPSSRHQNKLAKTSSLVLAGDREEETPMFPQIPSYEERSSLPMTEIKKYSLFEQTVAELDRIIAEAILSHDDLRDILSRAFRIAAISADSPTKPLGTRFLQYAADIKSKDHTGIGNIVADYLERRSDGLALTIQKNVSVSGYGQEKLTGLGTLPELSEMLQLPIEYHREQNDDQQQDTITQQSLESFMVLNPYEMTPFFGEPWLSSDAFRGLLEDLSGLIKTNPSAYIQEQIMRTIGLSNIYSEVTFRVAWEANTFIDHELEVGASLRSFIVLIGSIETAWATTVEDYVEKVWPRTGPYLLAKVENAVASHKPALPIGRPEVVLNFESYENFELDADCDEDISALKVRVLEATLVQILEIGQQLAWLAAVLRVSEGPLKYTDAIFEEVKDGVFHISLSDLTEAPISPSTCWHVLFPDRVIARGFPILRRPKARGVEIEFPLMTYLSFSHYSLSWRGGTIFVGDTNILVATSSWDSAVQWHLVPNREGSDPETIAEVLERFEGSGAIPTPISFSLETASNYRTFLGFCESVQIYLGNQGPSTARISSSHAPEDNSGFRLRREITLGLSFSGSGIVGGQLGFKANLPKRQALHTPFNDLDLDQALWNTQTQCTLMYDTDTKIAWLVRGPAPYYT